MKTKTVTRMRVQCRSAAAAPVPPEADPWGDEDAVIFKHEGHSPRRAEPIGPVWIRRGGKNTNYRDTRLKRPDGRGFYAEWFSLRQATNIAKDLRLPFGEV